MWGLCVVFKGFKSKKHNGLILGGIKNKWTLKKKESNCLSKNPPAYYKQAHLISLLPSVLHTFPLIKYSIWLQIGYEQKCLQYVWLLRNFVIRSDELLLESNEMIIFHLNGIIQHTTGSFVHSAFVETTPLKLLS